ncbi:unnamed protein product [Fraxinus pennsylvanica]|uniref:Uncharacterized protein n=1 Tax=Fraxinus pennsylvanica TaxID=56036 RepID=A0AAD2A597_9LAMI|nr:unnamed protein product [Fraxinus pennsylvanica]
MFHSRWQKISDPRSIKQKQILNQVYVDHSTKEVDKVVNFLLREWIQNQVVLHCLCSIPYKVLLVILPGTWNLLEKGPENRLGQSIKYPSSLSGIGSSLVSNSNLDMETEEPILN